MFPPSASNVGPNACPLEPRPAQGCRRRVSIPDSTQQATQSAEGSRLLPPFAPSVIEGVQSVSPTRAQWDAMPRALSRPL
jgi:hypothetical protein